ncbi:MAG: hypothetical protein Q8M23_04925 [Bacteroidales bacterium]|nr:hypothetical protein [Bacteroidales bacterium]
MLLFAGAKPVEAQTTVNKQLYLKTGALLNRVVPTSGTPQSSASLFKQIAVIGATSTATSGAGLGISSPMTIPHTTGENSNRLMIVTIVSDPANSGPNSVVNSVTYGVTALTKLADTVNGANVKVELWYLKAPASGLANVVISWTPNANLQIIAGVTTLYNTDQESPFSIIKKSVGSGNSASLSVPSELGDFVFDALGNAKSALTVGSGQTLVYDENTNKLNGGASYKIGIAGTTPMTWSFQQSNIPFAYIGVALKGQSNDIAFTQSPAMCGSFTIKSGSTITILANAAVTSGAASGATLPLTAELKHGATTVFSSSSAANSGLDVNGSTGTLTWTGTRGTDYTIPASGILTLELYSDYTAANIRIDYDATTKPSRIILPTSTATPLSYINKY